MRLSSCAEVRQEYGASWGVNQAKEIIQRCKQENILVRFLEQREKEVIGMMTTDVEYVNWMNSKWKENYQQGMEQGREQGIQLKQERVAKEMLADHMPMELIMKYSELSEERILELKKVLSCRRALAVNWEKLSLTKELPQKRILRKH